MAPPSDISERRQRASLKSKKRWVRRILWLIVWWFGAVIISRLHQDSLRMYVIVTTFIAIFAALGWRQRRKIPREGVKSNIHERFGTIASLRRRCVEFNALKNIGTPEAIRVIRDEAFRQNLINSPPDAPSCCCGSGRPFAECCRVLQEELRRCGAET
ncbi:uncharacterized protein TEOVI_000609000 [Trypanosoma equiperdum]|uniref:SAYSvFN domain-containing protein n=2 Tax=Trypanozoon TaxID=39700 RepID=Q387K2_TRYB2|nr:hypothetical protein, conserved [Trypanosoma brucei brucei TREU927]EAN79029.1 hypothetical protein, conserved [Trypanosoma brucei brucei TREU927]SCU67742.1 hypothetical protein, conserved [Trypanosoma equiperdum]